MKEPECSIDFACYRNHGFGIICPQLHCGCGYVAEGENWEEAGVIMDEHLEDEE